MRITSIVESMLESGVPVRFQAKGFSMAPFIKNGDILTLLPFDSRNPLPGDVVGFIHPENKEFIVHRIIDIEGKYYLIKGDNIPGPDGLIPRENILGYVGKAERNGKAVRFGLGRERHILAFLGRDTVLLRVFLRLMRFMRFLRKRMTIGVGGG